MQNEEANVAVSQFALPLEFNQQPFPSSPPIRIYLQSL